MRKIVIAASLLLAVAGFSVLPGCDREISSEKQTEVKSDGTVKTDKKVVTEKADGTIVQEEKHTEDHK